MGKKNKRVTRELFRVVMKDGASYHSPHFSFRVITDGIQSYHTAVVVSKKVATRAVIRNKIKRRGYYTIQTFLLSIRNPFVGVFFAKKGVEALPYSLFKEEITSLLHKAKLL